VIRTDPQCVAQPAGALRDNIFGKYSRGFLLLDEGQDDDLGLFEVAVGIDAAR
jgi:hypothetical protein